MASPGLFALKPGFPFSDDEIPDPEKLNYCGYTCPDDCTFKRATLENNPELKKQAWEEWKIKERYGLDFNESQAFCYGCKDTAHPEGVPVVNCTVRSCVQSRGLDCCIECKKLKRCDKELWRQFPSFYEKVLEMQAQYMKL
jgi:hypothetical protein